MKKYLTTLPIALVFLGISTVLPASSASAVNCSATDLTTQQAIQCGAQGANGGNAQSSDDAVDGINKTITSIVNVLSVVVAIVAVIMIILGGFRYITSAGAADKVKSAKDTILYALIGLIIVAMAQAVVRFVINQATTPPSTTSTPNSNSSGSTPAGTSSGTRGGKPPLIAE